MPESETADPSAPLGSGRDDKGEGNWLTLAVVKVDGQNQHDNNQPDFVGPRSLQRIHQVAPFQKAIPPLIWNSSGVGQTGRLSAGSFTALSARPLGQSKRPGARG